MTSNSTQAKAGTPFLGHPIGLAWLAASEFWERFAYYGMQTLLVLYMTHSLFTPGHIEHVWGFPTFRRVLEGMYGHLSPLALASNINGLYAGLVYVTPLGGGFLADRVIGRTNAVTIGALLMVAGGFLLAADATFLPGLLCLLVGVGCFKGNIASQVGDLYTVDDPRRADAFQIYFLGIQLAVIISPFICGTLGEKYNWHWGFAAAGAGMALGLAIYLFGRKTFPPEPGRKKGDRVARPPLTDRDWRAVILLVALLPVLALSVVGNQEIFNAYLIWAQKNYQLVFFGKTMPITWMISLDAFISAGLVAFSALFWRWFGRHWKEPDEITKIVIGVAISAGAPLALSGASAVVAATGHPVSIGWAFAFHILNDLGFANVLPVGLALYSRAAPKGLGGIMIAVYYLHLFLGNMLTGYLGGLLGTMPDTTFWLMHAGIMAVSAAILLVVRFTAAHLVAPTRPN
jgi:POT family proton-dependent oligopeptide transporter